jgi:hypothetical protein
VGANAKVNDLIMERLELPVFVKEDLALLK